ncbi:uncharacterized protein DSM5745_10701 [Aspergillus mulundensis]|uniref:Uncharacterized protein n=1 Tax=Aspergillus mulundensis TaxID=1810919 RepID=A0A3D8QH84_9EURO|nr:hypothetical protein DSM5745_10701 [Aspergillus mulundensis]RDW61203.1 hypothetical protein DSM5745_10701 [Aspergillus mulundensis]
MDALRRILDSLARTSEGDYGNVPRILNVFLTHRLTGTKGLPRIFLEFLNITPLHQPGNISPTADHARHPRKHNQRAISTPITPAYTALPRQPLNQRLTQRPRDQIPNAPPGSETRKHNRALGRGLPAHDVAHDAGPCTRVAASEEAVDDREDVQRPQRHREPPDQKHADGGSDCGDEDAQRYVELVDDGAHDHAADHRRDVEQDHSQRLQTTRCAEHPRVRGEIDTRKEESERLDGITQLKERKRARHEEAQVRNRRLHPVPCRRNPWLNEVHQRRGEDEQRRRECSQRRAEPPARQHLLHHNGEDDAAQPGARPHDAEREALASVEPVFHEQDAGGVGD